MPVVPVISDPAIIICIREKCMQPVEYKIVVFEKIIFSYKKGYSYSVI